MPILEPARAAKRSFHKSNEHELGSALNAIVCGGVWHHQRNGSNMDMKCHRCGAEDTPWHAYWGCSALKTQKALDVKNAFQ